MPKANRLNYDIAAQLVATGAWRVDADGGVVYGRRGNPFRRMNSAGYIHIRFCDPTDPKVYRTALAHRVIFESVHGPLPDDMTVNHIDGEKTNNRVANLEALSAADNVKHAWRSGLVKGHAGSANGNAVLNEDAAREIYRRAWAGEDQREIGAAFGVGRDTVSNIKVGVAWAHATGAKRTA